MSDTTPAQMVWAVMASVGATGNPPSTVVRTVHYRYDIPEVDVRECLNALLAHGHLILDGEGVLRRVPDSGIKSVAMAYGLDEEDVAMVFHVMTGAVKAGDTTAIDVALRQVVEAKAVATPKRTRRRPDA